MPTQLLPLGQMVTLLANVVYALPAVRCTVFTTHGTPTLEMSNDFAYTFPGITLTMTNGSALADGTFIRTATSGVQINLKRA
jgi:hypothetical protein